ncbi:heme exporter protein CcmB [Candidatus Tisiphia endosymbiont of Beris chalybata]|uniref:heme exporter protein CcmB n=1 Tax=Candidatus Tisiphia endosymbiont of Beris chalybata TaxID=3066262 RepID=UPI00312C9CD1
MKRLIQLIKWEYLIQNRINNLTKYLIIFFLFCAFSLTLINDQENLTKFGVMFSIILLPLALVSCSHIIFTQDLEDGNLELLFTNFTEHEIIISKFLTICFIAISSAMFNMPIIYFFFNIELETFIHMVITLILLLILASALLILIAAIQSYFRSNANLLSVLIMPLLIPSIVLGGIITQNPNNISLAFCMVGINIVLLPIILYLASYLIRNIYNV